MGKNSKIDWTDHTWNPWQGCRRVSPGCINCYMIRDKIRYGQLPHNVVRSKPPTFNKPNKWKEPALVFVCSWSDFFIEEADLWRDDAWEIIRSNPHLTFQLLTKRPENIAGRLPPWWGVQDHVWLGVTCETQELAAERIPILQSIPAPVRFLSIEPMLEPINLFKACGLSGIDWVIVGGESGPKARGMESGWAIDVMHECIDANIPFFMKQMSGKLKPEREDIPEYLMVRQFPKDYNE